MSVSKSNLFLTEFMFINLALRLLKSLPRKRFVSRSLWAWFALTKFRYTGTVKLIFCCWRQLNFFKNTEKIYVKTFIPLWFKYNLLWLICLLEPMPSLWVINRISFLYGLCYNRALKGYVLLPSRSSCNS